MPSQPSPPADPDVPRGEAAGAPRPARNRKVIRWILIAVAALFFLAILREAINPFGDAEYTEINHGNHSHYVPKDRDPNVGIDAFPTRPPGPNERILPDGRIVPK